jgi:hypothetical protein
VIIGTDPYPLDVSSVYSAISLQIFTTMKYVLIILLATIPFGFTKAQSDKRFLVILAHPDDETALAEVLIKYRKNGNKIHLVIATDGKDGTRVTSIPAGDSLGNLRRDESRCACKKMQMNRPYFLESRGSTRATG